MPGLNDALGLNPLKGLYYHPEGGKIVETQNYSKPFNGDREEILGQRPRLEWNNLADGLNRVIIGLFLKVFLADNIATLVDTGFALSPSHLGGLDVLTLAFLFGFQIYFDFAGYSHIAIGCAKMMEINFPENFNFLIWLAIPVSFENGGTHHFPAGSATIFIYP